MFEAEEIHEFRVFDLTDDDERETVRVNIRFASDDGMSIYAEAIDYATEDDDMMTKVTQDRMSRFVKRLVQKTFDEAALRAVMETHPAFDMMPFDQPPVSRSIFQQMRI